MVNGRGAWELIILTTLRDFLTYYSRIIDDAFEPLNCQTGQPDRREIWHSLTCPMYVGNVLFALHLLAILTERIERTVETPTASIDSAYRDDVPARQKSETNQIVLA